MVLINPCKFQELAIIGKIIKTEPLFGQLRPKLTVRIMRLCVRAPTQVSEGQFFQSWNGVRISWGSAVRIIMFINCCQAIC